MAGLARRYVQRMFFFPPFEHSSLQFDRIWCQPRQSHVSAKSHTVCIMDVPCRMICAFGLPAEDDTFLTQPQSHGTLHMHTANFTWHRMGTSANITKLDTTDPLRAHARRQVAIERYVSQIILFLRRCKAGVTQRSNYK